MAWGRLAALTVGGTLVAAVGLPAGLVLGLGATMALAPKDFPAYDRGTSASVSPVLVLPGRSGAPGPPAAPPAAEPTLTAARETLLAAQSRFLRRERSVSAILDRYRPTATRRGRRATPALLDVLARTAALHAKARAEIEAQALPGELAAARAATIRMLEHAEAAQRAVIDAARRRDPEFALAREPSFRRALGEHYAALAALRHVPPRSVSASFVAPGS